MVNPRGRANTGSAAANAAVTTIEGIFHDGSHPVQIAWEQIDVPQCGYCQAGQIMSACALLAKNGKPTNADIDSAMNGNLCRCGTYLRVRAAIHQAAELTASEATKPAESGANAAGANRLPRRGGK